MQERSEAERRAIWPCLNVATWRRERSDKYANLQKNQVPYILAVTAPNEESPNRLYGESPNRLYYSA